MESFSKLSDCLVSLIFLNFVIVWDKSGRPSLSIFPLFICPAPVVPLMELFGNLNACLTPLISLGSVVA